MVEIKSVLISILNAFHKDGSEVCNYLGVTKVVLLFAEHFSCKQDRSNFQALSISGVWREGNNKQLPI